MILTIMNQKGGVGKTTTVINLGVNLAKLGKSVLLVDLDPQANLTSGLGLTAPSENASSSSGQRDITGQNNKQKTVYDILVNEHEVGEIFLTTNYPDLHVLPSGIELSGAEVEMVSMLSREGILKKALSAVKDKYDFILIDCPPSLGILTINALVAADSVLVPIQCEYFALEGLGQLMNTVKLVRNNLNPALEIGGVILTMFDSRTNLSRDVAEEVKKYFKDKVFGAVIPRNIRLSEAPSHGMPIEEYDANSTGAKAYRELAAEVVEKF